ncbi:TPA: hypothetical protein DCZ39_01870 [Patescibacteria group bacterium]|nr:hypothetical protein [Candidatus Gracilibacteria bacterium]
MITTGVIILTQSYIFKIFEQLSSLRHIMRGTNKTIGESIEMIEILDEAHEIQDHTDKNLEVHSGKIEFNTVRFNYIDGRNIFNNLTLRIKPGEKVAIVGQSG